MTGAVDLGTIEQAFRVAAAELGMCDAAWRFAQQLSTAGGPEVVEQVRDGLGRVFPVLDAVFSRHLASTPAPSGDASAAARACAGLRRLVLVGLEARWTDALVKQLEGVELAVLLPAALPGDVGRVMANLPPAVQHVTLDDFQRLAGPKSGLLTFVYGATAQGAFVLPEWVRAQGPDVRAQFRSFIGWAILDAPPDVYPRWLVEVPPTAFTALVS
ncbi:MAG: hypothetical protein JNJ54_36575 [Myxococcaceae bacterium]|nr:hypothetical protein [Myxococcaceae bacterium]